MQCLEVNLLNGREGSVLESVTHVHMVGIGGSGMSGIAEVLMGLGYRVSGSDLSSSSMIERLRSLGAEIDVGHDSCHVKCPDLVVVSSAVPRDNPELVESVRLKIPIVGRGVILAELAGFKRTIAVAGSHGKTTTASMVASVMEMAGTDPTSIIGGKIRADGSNARLGSGPLMVIEADESDRSFLLLKPNVAVLTNIDTEHLEAYAGMSDLENSFAEFSSKVLPGGCVIGCADDLFLARLMREIDGPALSYGIDNSDASVRAHQVKLDVFGSQFRVAIKTNVTCEDIVLKLKVPGRHNVLNALAALTVGVWFGTDLSVIVSALEKFLGVERRFEFLGEFGGVKVIDDYGHHPTEIVAALETARLGLSRRLIVVFQPHRFSRTRRLVSQFGSALSLADELILTDVFAASEPPLPGASAESIMAAIRDVSNIAMRKVKSLDEAASTAIATAYAGDVIVVLGAGSIGRVAPRIVAGLKELAS